MPQVGSVGLCRLNFEHNTISGTVRNNNLLLTEREGRTGEYWPEVVTVRTEHREVSTKTTEGQYSPVWLEQARLVSSLLYGTRLMLYIYFQTHFRLVKFKGLPARDDASNSERTRYHDFEKKFIEHLPNVLQAKLTAFISGLGAKFRGQHSPYTSFKCNWIGVAEISCFR